VTGGAAGNTSGNGNGTGGGNGQGNGAGNGSGSGAGSNSGEAGANWTGCSMGGHGTDGGPLGLALLLVALAWRVRPRKAPQRRAADRRGR